MKKTAPAAYAIIFAATMFNPVLAQSDQSATGGGVIVGGNNEGFVNTGEIRIILNSEASLVDDPEAKQVIERLGNVLSNLVENGELSLSETAARVLARDAIQQLASQPLTRGVISTRQFTAPYQQTQNIAGTNNRITYLRNSCKANFGITFRFNREEHCWLGVGGSLEFTEGGRTYELVFDGFEDSRKLLAKFTIYPVN